MRNFQDLVIWQKSHQLTLRIYATTNNFPKHEIFGITSQMRRSASSIPTNIAEGCGKNSNAEMKRFLLFSTGSCSELEYQIILSKDLNYISESLFKELQQEIIAIRKMIHAFIEKIKQP